MRSIAVCALGKNLLQRLFASVETEATDVQLATATAATAATAATITASIASASLFTSTVSPSPVFAAIAATGGVTRRWRGWTALLARGAAGTMPSSFRHLRMLSEVSNCCRRPGCSKVWANAKAEQRGT